MLRLFPRSPLRCHLCPPPSPPPRRRLHATESPLLCQPPQRGRNSRRRRSDRDNVRAPSAAAPSALLVSDPLLSFSSPVSSLSAETVMPFFSLSFLHLTPGEKHALTLSTLAGMSTTLGALIAIIRRPNAADLAFLLGIALGVMGVLSVCEMWLHNAHEHGAVPVSLAFAGGAAAYCLLAPLLPEVSGAAGGRWGLGCESSGSEDGEGTPLVDASVREKLSASSSSSAGAAARGGARRAPAETAAAAPAAAATAAAPASKEPAQPAPAPPLPSPPLPAPPPLSPAELLRLGLVVAVAMTAHNLPEGFAVAFSSFTPLGPTMVFAIAAHNIPEGIVVAAPVFAATGSRLAALGLAAASGMSEPVGAAAALFLARPWLPGAAGTGGGAAGEGAGGAAAAAAAAGALAASRLSLVLAASGGVMAAVCAVDLYPQGKKCAAPSRLAAGSVLGALAMAATLALGV